MSKEYIEKERALQLLEENASDDEVFFAARAIEAEPPADVKPVSKGKWIFVLEGVLSTIYRCSHCGNYFAEHSDTLNAGRGDKKFCPNCGADMREEENDER